MSPELGYVDRFGYAISVEGDAISIEGSMSIPSTRMKISGFSGFVLGLGNIDF